MSFKRVLIMAVFAAIALPGAAHAQVRFGFAVGGPVYRPFYGPRVGVFVGLPPVSIGFGGPVYVQPAPVYYPAPYYVQPAPVAYAPVASPVMVAQPQAFQAAPPALPAQPVPVPPPPIR
jgi:hypothetical protein